MITVHRQKINHQEPKANRTKSPSGSMWKKKKLNSIYLPFHECSWKMKQGNNSRRRVH